MNTVTVHPVRAVIFKLIKLEQATARLSWWCFMGFVCYYLIAWTILGLVLWLILIAVDAGEVGVLRAVLIYAFSGLSGMLSIVTPSGLGVREGVMAFLLNAQVSSVMAVLVAIVARLVATAGEVLMILLGYFGIKLMRLERPTKEGV